MLETDALQRHGAVRMPIVVDCGCGKRFKAKDSLAGRKVRCPGCREPLRIPGGQSKSDPPIPAGSGAGRKGKSGGDQPDVDAEAAILKFEEVTKQKALDAEAEAAFREEQNKLIESYDQISGRTAAKGKGAKKKKTDLAEGKVKKRTAFTKIADGCGAVLSNLLVKYLIIAAIIGGGALGSVFLVKTVTSYIGKDTAPQLTRQERVKELYKQFDIALKANQLSKAKQTLEAIIRLDPSKERNRNYTTRLKKLEAADSRR